MKWKREVVHESDFSYSVYSAQVGGKRAEIRCLDGGTRNKKYGADLLLERMVSEKPEEWDVITDREWFQTYAQAQRVAAAWLNE